MNRLLRAAFIAYALLLTAATLWPGVQIHGPVERTDLWIHVFAFALWTLLLYASGFLAPRTNWRSVALTAIVSIAWAGLNEWSQQFFNRVTAADDFAANTAGVWLATVLCAVWCARTQRNSGNDSAAHR